MIDSDREVTAHHEAGHAVARVLLDLPFRYVTIRPRTPGTVGNIAVRPVMRPGWALAITAAAGPWAERQWLLDYLQGDEEEAAFVASLLGGCNSDEVDVQGLLASGGWPYSSSPADAADRLLRPWTGAVAAVAGLLLERGTLTGRDVAGRVTSALSLAGGGASAGCLDSERSRRLAGDDATDAERLATFPR